MYETCVNASRGCIAPRLSIFHSIKSGDATINVKDFHDVLLRIKTTCILKRSWSASRCLQALGKVVSECEQPCGLC